MKPLLEGGFDVVHCLEREVCNTVHDHRHLFQRTPKVVFSNGGAIAARDLPRCDFVQEHSAHNLLFSARHKAFLIPHGVDLQRFRPGLPSDFRARHGIPADAFVVISVGTIGHSHKRMDHVIEEVAALDGVRLLVVGQQSPQTPAIKALGQRLMGERIVFARSAVPQRKQRRLGPGARPCGRPGSLLLGALRIRSPYRRSVAGSASPATAALRVERH